MSIELNPAPAFASFSASSSDAPRPQPQPSIIIADEYEFSVVEDAVITTLSRRMKVSGALTMGFAALQALLALASAAGQSSMLARFIVAAFISASLAAAQLSAARWFDKITSTKGNDIAHLMMALGRLSQYFLVHAALASIAAVLVVLLVLLTLASL